MDVIQIIQKHQIPRCAHIRMLLPCMVLSLLVIIIYAHNYMWSFWIIWIIILHPFSECPKMKTKITFEVFIQNNIINPLFNLKNKEYIKY